MKQLYEVSREHQYKQSLRACIQSLGEGKHRRLRPFPLGHCLNHYVVVIEGNKSQAERSGLAGVRKWNSEFGASKVVRTKSPRRGNHRGVKNCEPFFQTIQRLALTRWTPKKPSRKEQAGSCRTEQRFMQLCEAGESH